MANHDPHRFEATARACGFRGFGFYPKKRMMHVDLGPSRSWGTPWPAAAEAFPEEPPEPREDLKGSRTIGGAKVAGGAVVAREALNDPEVSTIVDQATGWSSALPDSSTLKWLLVAAAALALGWVVYARWDDFRKGKR